MPHFVADKVIKLMIKKGQKILNSNVLVLGVTFKKNCPDIRNTKIIDVVNEFEQFGCNVDLYDPWANPAEVKREYKKELLSKDKNIYDKKYDAIILATAHDEFHNIDLSKLKRSDNSVVYDIKGVWSKDEVDGRL
jgi:UDP-N-acetyl-D-galactosamine dehydrogenase